MTDNFRSGYVSIIGRPNVGKSTLLNVILDQKIAIVSPKPQTTRNRLTGIKTSGDSQIIFIDTPGIHKPRNLLGKSMVSKVPEVLAEIDLVVLVVEAGGSAARDADAIESLRGLDKPVFLVINKIDSVKKKDVLTIISEYRELFPFREIIPVSALKKDGIDLLLDKIREYLPVGPLYYPNDLVTDQIERFMAAEIIREKIIYKTSEEIPYCVAVEVIDWKEREDGLVSISANIYVERQSQKGIIIGEKGKMLKTIGSLARVDIERLLDTRVFLQLWVKVLKGWCDDKKALHELGYR